MKWYPLAQLDAVAMSCFYPELQALKHCSCCVRPPLVGLLEELFPHSCYTVHAHLSISGLEMSAIGVPFRQLKTFSAMSKGEA